ncbi:MAG TPA: transposase [Baekduia sp.]|uniref:transposase n=1 Tax=Baekduia sp. TaxID=2600305 RepID=UPI002C3F3CE4|nr:transposase [Baekduia sp.]HMJ35933.1 transposase [Baekduia sp.]
MARKLRDELEGGVHHVYARGNDGCDIYVDDVDRARYLTELARAVLLQGWRCLAYCLMSNHVHLLVETPSANLGDGMRRLHGDYARGFNQRHDRRGHLFQGRFGSVLVRDDAQLWAAAAYVAVNPVEAGLCRRPEQWPWSSHAATVASARMAPPPWLDVARLLWHFGAAGGDPVQRYVTYVADRLARPRA